jgi:phospholipid transport system substrate-binding protein
VGTQLLRPDKSPVSLDYVVRQGPVGWQVVDVLADGTISRVAVQRSDFRDLLMAGGVSALVAGLNRKVAALSGGVLPERIGIGLRRTWRRESVRQRWRTSHGGLT